MENKILAPCDGFVKDIKELNDGVFSELLLGDGVCFIPSERDFYSIANQANLVQIFDTKHAYFFKMVGIENPILMHIGIDTVKLEGLPFDVKQKEKQILTKNDLIVSVDLDYILSKECLIETPIVFEGNDKYIVKNKKTGEVKKGDVLFEIFSSDEKTIDNEDILDKPIIFVGKYSNIAEQIYKYVGTNVNFRTYRNCMTRLRFTIKNKDDVDIDNIKKISIVKGINWSGDELQIIIGGEVYKVKEALDSYLANKDNFETKNKQKSSFKKEALSLIQAVVIPMMPILMAAGILQALYTLLSDQVIGLYPTIVLTGENALPISSYAWYNIMLYIIATPGTAFLAIFFLHNTVKHYKGNTVVAFLIAFILASPYLMGANIEAISWFTLKLGAVESNIGIKAYPTSVIPMVAAGMFYVWFDNWVKKWMPTSVDIIFRHALSVIVTCSATFLIFGNLLGIVEAMIGYCVSLLDYVPLGISTGLFAIIWQPLVLTGTHSAVANAIMIPAYNDATVAVPILMGRAFGVFGQLAAAIGIAIKTKNANVRTAAVGGIPAAVFGITEPIIYASTLRNGTPFIFGCIAAGLGATVFDGVFGGEWYLPDTQGVFAVLSAGKEVIQYVGFAVGFGVTLLSGILLTLFFFHERVDELKATHKINKKLIDVISLKTNISKKELKVKYENKLQELEQLINSELKTNIKNIELNIRKSIVDSIKLNQKIAILNATKEKLARKSSELYEKNNLIAMKKVNKKFYELENSDFIDNLENIKLQSQLLANESLNNLNKIQDKFLKITDSFIDEIVKETKEDKILLFKNNYYNAIHSLDIAYEINDKNLDIFTNKTLKKGEEINEKITISR